MFAFFPPKKILYLVKKDSKLFCNIKEVEITGKSLVRKSSINIMNNDTGYIACLNPF